MLLRDFIVLDSPMWIIKEGVVVLFPSSLSPLVNEAKLQGVWEKEGIFEWINDECQPVRRAADAS